MGFTVYNNKNGKVIPIKMSIWDAFRGVPDPRPPKPKPCSCCGKFHKPKKILSESKSEKGKKASYSTSEEVKWTAKEDAIILEMKSPPNIKPWTEISAALGGKGSKATINERYKELSQRSGKAEDNMTEAEKRAAEKKAIGERKKAENLAKNAKAGKKGKGGDTKTWGNGFESNNWLVIASKHYDKTGERLSRAAAQKLAKERS